MLPTLSVAFVSRLGGSFCNVSNRTFIGGYLWYGAVPVTISIAVIPKLHMSALKSYPCTCTVKLHVVLQQIIRCTA